MAAFPPRLSMRAAGKGGTSPLRTFASFPLALHYVNGATCTTATPLEKVSSLRLLPRPDYSGSMQPFYGRLILSFLRTLPRETLSFVACAQIWVRTYRY